MMKSFYDIILIGHVSRDVLVDGEETEHILGGAVTYSSPAAARSGASVLVVTKANPDDYQEVESMKECGSDLLVIPSSQTTSIENVYLSKDKEKRTLNLLSQAEPFTLDEIPDAAPKIYHLAGLFRGEIPDDFIIPLSKRAQIALDVQGQLRKVESKRLMYCDWEVKRELLPYITYLKTDAAEAEILSGEEDRYKAASILLSWGAQEVMVTHHSEVIVATTQDRVYSAPLRPRNLSGRSGRGDTTFASYLAYRLNHGIQESVEYAAALVSIKMESPGPFHGTVEDVQKRMKELLR